MTTRNDDQKAVAARALGLLDLTNLNEDCDSAAIEKLCRDADTPFGPVAAICIWPRFVAEARRHLGAGHRVKIATVLNFPSGEEPVGEVTAQTAQAIADGADEIDLVIPYRALLGGREAAVSEMVQAVREAAAAPIALKTILETGELQDASLIRNASHLCIRQGADFLKTSTGKVPVNATLEAADLMLTSIMESGRQVGFKAAGGVKTAEDAARYIDLAETVMGRGWVTPATFRFGASGLLTALLAALDDSAVPAPAAGESGY